MAWDKSRRAWLRDGLGILVLAGLLWCGGFSLGWEPSSQPASHNAALAQVPDLSGQSRVRIEAGRGVEWHQDRQMFRAHGGVVVRRGEIVLRAESLNAYYRNQDPQDVFRIEAQGNLELTVADTHRVTAQQGIYDTDQAVLVLSGQPLRWEGVQGVITARDSMEYYDQQRLFVARGQAIIELQQEQLRADILLGALRLVEDELILDRIDGIGSVLVTRPGEIAQADHLIFSLTNEVVILTGSVQLTRANSQLSGEVAEFDRRTGVIRILGFRHRVRGRIDPSDNPGL